MVIRDRYAFLISPLVEPGLMPRIECGSGIGGRSAYGNEESRHTDTEPERKDLPCHDPTDSRWTNNVRSDRKV